MQTRPGYYVDLTNWIVDPDTSPCKPADDGSHVPTNASWPVDTSIAFNQTTCPAGTFQSASGTNFCFDCTLGTSNPSPGRTVECDSCLDGEYQNETGATSCRSCANPATPAGSSQCLNCPAGEWETDTGTCDPCPRGFACSGKTETNQTKPTKIACSDAGVYAGVTGTLSCAPVLPGSYKKLEAGAETPSFQTVSGADVNTEVETCPVGYKCTGGAARPAECPAHEYAKNTSSTICFPVVAGYYRVSSSSVKACPKGSKCAGEANQPELCPVGRFASNEGANDCNACADGTFTTAMGQSSCTACPKLRTKCENGKLTFDQKTWYPPKTVSFSADTEVHECFNDECCELSSNRTSMQCAVTKGYHGPLCGACDRDNDEGHGSFTRSGSGCAMCWENWKSWLAVVCIGLCIVSGLAYIVFQHSFAAARGDYGATVQKITISHVQVRMSKRIPGFFSLIATHHTELSPTFLSSLRPSHQMLGVLGIFKAKGTSVFNEVASRPAEIVGGSVTSMLPIKCVLESQIYGPFILTMALPFLLVAVASLFILLRALCEKKMRKQRQGKEPPRFKGKMNLPRWIAFHKKLRLPMTEDDIKEWHAEFQPAERISGVTVFIIFTLYVSLVASIASLYNCTAPIEGKAYLVADLTVICYEGLHLAFLTFASVGAIVFAIGIPTAVAVAVTLRSPCFRENGKMTFECRRRTPEEYTSASMRSRFAFLFNGESIAMRHAYSI